MKGKTYYCNLCGYEWVGRVDNNPVICAACKNYNWNKKVDE